MLPLILLGAAGLGMQAFGGIMAGRAAKRAGKAEAERLEYNADIADLQAADALQRGVDAAGKQRAVTRQVIGTQRAGFAGQNVDVNVGSAVDVQADAALLGEHDAQQITANAEREAWGYRVEAVDRRLAARNARQNGNAAGNAAYFQTAGTLMTGTGLLAEKYGWPPPKPTSTPSTPRYTVNW